MAFWGSTVACSDSAMPPHDGASNEGLRPDTGIDLTSDLGASDHAATDSLAPPDASFDQGSTTCPRTPGPADAPRWVVVSHPFLGPGKMSNAFEVLALSKSGALTKTNETFQLGVATDGEIVFTPDGAVGLVAVEGGKIGVFRLDAAGKVTVVHTAFSGAFYASRIIMGPEGKKAYVLDGNWRNNGGGIYRVGIACDGTLTDEGLIVPSKLAYAARFIDSDRLLLGARDVGTSKAGDDAHVVNLKSDQLSGGADAFGDDDAIISDVALTHDQRYGLLADNAAFSSVAGDRIAVVSLNVAKGTLSPVQILTGLKDPVGIVTSPWDNAALVLGAQADRLSVLDYDPASRTPFTLRGKLTTSNSTLLPGVAVMIRRGSLEGRVIIAENLQLRQVQFQKNGNVDEVEVYSLGSGILAIPGALGVTP